MTSILSSFKECPSYMRAAFRNLARRVSDHFGDEPGYEVNLEMILENIGSPQKTGLKRGHTRVIEELQWELQYFPFLSNFDPSLGAGLKNTGSGRVFSGSGIWPKYSAVFEIAQNFLDGIRDVTATREAGLGEILERDEVLEEQTVFGIMSDGSSGWGIVVKKKRETNPQKPPLRSR